MSLKAPQGLSGRVQVVPSTQTQLLSLLSLPQLSFTSATGYVSPSSHVHSSMLSLPPQGLSPFPPFPFPPFPFPPFASWRSCFEGGVQVVPSSHVQDSIGFFLGL